MDPTQKKTFVLCGACRDLLVALLKEREVAALREAQDPQTPCKRLEELSRSSAFAPRSRSKQSSRLGAPQRADHIREALARNPNTPPEALDLLASELFPLIEQNPAAFLHSLEDPARLEHWSMLYGEHQLLHGAAYTGRATISGELLERLSHSTNTSTQRLVAVHHMTPPETLARLARDESVSWIRSSVAKNPNTPRAALVELCKDKERHVLKGLVENEAVPLQVKLGLVRDESIWGGFDADYRSDYWGFFWLDSPRDAPRGKGRKHHHRRAARQARIDEIEQRRAKRERRESRQRLAKGLPAIHK